MSTSEEESFLPNLDIGGCEFEIKSGTMTIRSGTLCGLNIHKTDLTIVSAEQNRTWYIGQIWTNRHTADTTGTWSYCLFFRITSSWTFPGIWNVKHSSVQDKAYAALRGLVAANFVAAVRLNLSIFSTPHSGDFGSVPCWYTSLHLYKAADHVHLCLKIHQAGHI